mmetsp:Transcript_7420/g.8136  ORF Transcript_7420/g.8136 Transcript_7420/m.8136 type:complete len:1242 (+) Transcript_7420:96-3821(+)
MPYIFSTTMINEAYSFLPTSFYMWRNTVLVTSITFFNASIFALILFLWAMNRQTQIRPSKSQSISSSSTKVTRRSESKNSFLKSQSDRIENEKEEEEVTGDLSSSASGSGNRDNALSSIRWDRRQSREDLVKSFSFDFGMDSDDENEFVQETSSSLNMSRQFALTPMSRNMKKDMIHFVSKMNVFSYLSDEAFMECLPFMKYVDIPECGSNIMKNNRDNLNASNEGNSQLRSDDHQDDKIPLDGSLYVVVSGSIDCTCYFNERKQKTTVLAATSINQASSKLKFQARPGDLVTSQLAMISDLIRMYQYRKNKSVDLSGNADYKTNDDCDNERSNIDICHPVTIHAITSTQNTRVIRIPPDAFLAIHDKFPNEVLQIAQTIIARTQRVTTQLLVKNLGLTHEIVLPNCDSIGKTEDSLLQTQKWKDQLEICRVECEKVSKTMMKKKHEKKRTLEVSEEVKQIAIQMVASKLGIKDFGSHKLLDNLTSIVYIKSETELVHAGKKSDKIYFVLNGEVEVGNLESSTGKHLFREENDEEVSFHISNKITAGGIIGLLPAFTGEVSMVTIKASSKSRIPSYLVEISKNTLSKLISHDPGVLIQTLDNILRDDFSPFVHLLDWGWRWRDVQAGSVLVHKGHPCESLWIVLNGRLRSCDRHDQNATTMSEEFEHGRGTCIGDIQVLTEDVWPHDVFATRNSEVAQLPIHVLDFIMRMFPTCGVHFAKVIAKQVQQRSLSKKDRLQSRENDKGLPSYNLSLATVAIVPACFGSDSENISDFCHLIFQKLEKIAPCALMTKDIVTKKFGKSFCVENTIHALKLSRLLGDLEENNRLVVYQAESKFTWWSRVCIQHADCILLVTRSNEIPKSVHLDQYLSLTQSSRLTKRVQMVVLDESFSSSQIPTSVTKGKNELHQWMGNRQYIVGCHLIRIPRMKMKYINMKDIDRMCRRITGSSLGLVLGGGGARGIAHLGVIKALLDLGVSVDLVGGTSQGAFIGALYAKSPDDFDDLLKNARKMADGMASIKEKVLDLTLPLISYFDGRRFNKVIMECLGKDTMIEDLILNFFCVSTDLCNYCQAVHKQGSCWKYVRASMSLHGFLPPVSEAGSLLVDGGYSAIVPNDVMSKQMGARAVIAVDVSREEAPSYYEYGAHLSGFWVLFNSWNPFVETVRVPSMGELSQRLIWVNSSKHQQNLADNVDLFLSPPVHHYGTLDYSKFDEIYEHGYNYAKSKIEVFLRNPANSWILHEKA